MANIVTTTDNPIDATGRPARHDGAYRGKRLSWTELYRQRPDLRPANDTRCSEKGSGTAQNLDFLNEDAYIVCKAA